MNLITWNIRWGRGADGRVDLARIVDHARRLADFDVLCLQEVADGYPELAGCDGSDQFAALAALLPDYTAVAGPAVDAPGPAGRRRRFGNLLVSRFAVLQVFNHLLPWPVDPDVKSMQRAALEATLETPLGLLRVTTTHLEHYSVRQRAAQVERLRELHREAVAHARLPRPGTPGPLDPSPRGGASILVGDFNCRPEAAERAQVMAPIADAPPYRDAWEIAHPGRPHLPTVGVHDKVQWPGPAFTFDYVFVSEDLSPYVRQIRVDAASDASDHQPVLLELG